MALKLRQLSPQEHDTIATLAHSRTTAARLVERARIILLADPGHRVPAIAQQLHLTAITVRTWLKRFNAAGLAAFTDQPRAGCPATYTPPQVAAVIATALVPPEQLGLPFASWTLDQLDAYMNEHKGIAMQRSRSDDLLLAEGLRWRTHETWLGERVDPAFAKNRGVLRNSIRPHLQIVSCSAWIKGALHRPRAAPGSNWCVPPRPPSRRPQRNMLARRSKFIPIKSWVVKA